jgi:hypothetical protein
LPIRFEENRGQTDSRVQFLARGAGYSLFLTSTEAVLKLRDDSTKLSVGFPAVAFPARKYSIVRMRLLGANPSAHAIGVDELPGKSNYFIGSDRARWHFNVATFSGVEFQDVYPGVSLKYGGAAGHLEYDFAIAPGVDPECIRIAIAGATNLAIDSFGDLVIETAGGSLAQKAPVIYQIVDGARRIVAGGYTMRDSHTVGFAIGAYDRDLPLVIDPLLSYASYLGGSLIDFGSAIAVDSSGDAIVTGYTDSADFPIAGNAFQPTLFENAGGADDAFISKINPDGSALIYSTYAGGSNEDEGTAVAVDGAGNAYVAGYTMSSDYPVTVGALQTNFSGSKSAFVTALDQNGGLIYSTFLNGSATSSAAGIAADAAGNAFVSGTTTSPDFPVTAGAYQTSFIPSNGHASAAFVAKLNPIGTALEYSTFLGPPNYIAARAIALDDADDAYIAGTTYAGGSVGAATCPANDSDCGFVARLDSAGANLDFSTLLNLPSSQDFGYTEPHAIAVDGAGGAHVVGNFGVSGEHFGFLENLDSAGTTSNLVNYSNALSPNGIALGSSGNIFVAGTVFGNNLATTPGAFQSAAADSVNAFLNEYDPGGIATLYSTYLGGSDQDEAFGVAVDPAGNAYVTGYTQSSDFPVTPAALQSSHGGGIAHAGTLDAFVARIVPSPALAPTPSSTATSTPTATETPVATVIATPTAIRTPLPTRVPSPSLTPTPVTPTAVPTTSAIASPTPIPSSVESIVAVPSPLQFDAVKTGRAGRSRFVAVMNPKRNNTPLTITSLVLASDGAGAPTDFALDASRSTCTPGLLLRAGGACRIAITFAPTSTGRKQDVLTVSVAPAAVATIPLLGVGK